MKKKYTSVLILLSLFIQTSNGQVKYTNPILAGFYPDPSICRVGNDYYLVNSSFSYFPGLPIFHSTDLVNWQQIGHALERNEQLDLSNAGVTRGLFAPTIRYFDSVYYIVCTLIDKNGNFIIKAKDPKGPWSNPIWLPEINGIDPSLFFDDHGKAFITYNGNPPDNKSLYSGHRTVRVNEFDVKKMKVVSKSEILVNGGVDISKKPVWIEGPHLFKKSNFYYLICAEGGTGTDHSEVVFRSDSVKGPYLPYSNNPILTQKGLDKNRENPITSAGHCDFVETENGKWYSVFLACRPYEGDYYNTGRETFLAPVEWNKDWPTIKTYNGLVGYKYEVPFPVKTNRNSNIYTGNVVFKDSFKAEMLSFHYALLRNPSKDLYKIDTKKQKLILPLKPTTVSEKDNPAFVGFRQSNLKCNASTSLNFSAKTENEKAGLLIFQNEEHFYFICKSIRNNKQAIEVYKSSNKDSSKNELIAYANLKSGKTPLQIKIDANNDTYSFYYSEKKEKYSLLKTLDAKFLSTKEVGGFVGCMFAMYATSNGILSSNEANFNWFNYEGNDDIYK